MRTGLHEMNYAAEQSKLANKIIVHLVFFFRPDTRKSPKLPLTRDFQRINSDANNEEYLYKLYFFVEEAHYVPPFPRFSLLLY